MREFISTVPIENLHRFNRLGDVVSAEVAREFSFDAVCPLAKAEGMLDILLVFPLHDGCRAQFAKINRHVRKHAPRVADIYAEKAKDIRQRIRERGILFSPSKPRGLERRQSHVHKVRRCHEK